MTRYWQVLSWVNLLLEEFAARYSGKTSPVHHFWHTFDIAMTRFSDKVIQQPVTTDSVTREAYSREVISFGFWFGDQAFPEPAFYSYTSPEPDRLAGQSLVPTEAEWVEQRGAHLAVLRYDRARQTPDPRSTVLGFYESAYQAGARSAVAVTVTVTSVPPGTWTSSESGTRFIMLLRVGGASVDSQ